MNGISLVIVAALCLLKCCSSGPVSTPEKKTNIADQEQINLIANADDGEQQLRAKRKNQQLAMFLAINSGPKHTTLNHHHPHKHGGNDETFTSEEFISRTLGEILLKALKDRGVVNVEKLRGEHNEDISDENEEDGEALEQDEVIREDLEELKHDIDEFKHSHKLAEEIEEENGGEESSEEFNDEDILAKLKETKRIKIEHKHEEHHKEKHEHVHSTSEISENITPQQVSEGSITIHQLQKLLKDTFGLKCACGNSEKTKIVVEKDSDEDIDESESDECVHPDFPIKKLPTKPHKKLNHHADIEIRLGKKTPSNVENSVNIHVNAKKSSHRRHTRPGSKTHEKSPVRINLDTAIEDINDASDSSAPKTTRSARRLHPSQTVADSDIIDELIDGAAAKSTHDLQFFRNHTHRSARHSAAAKRSHRHNGRRSSSRARRSRSEPSPVDESIANAASSHDYVDETYGTNADEVRQYEFGAGIRRSSNAIPSGTNAHGPATVHDSDGAAVSSAVAAKSDTADMLLKQFLGLYDQFKRSARTEPENEV